MTNTNNQNMSLWDSVSITDPSKVKPITGKSYKGSSPQPYWLVKRATETFGPCGQGWGIEIVQQGFQQCNAETMMHYATVRIWYMQDGKKCSVEHMGGTMAMYKTNTASIPVEKKTFDDSNVLQVVELKKLQQNAEQLLQAQDSNDDQHQTLLNGLLERAASAQSPVEANALVRYTSEWTEEQRKPLLNAIHNRLNELSASTAGNEEQPPSLMVQIENAKDLTELDCLEIKVYGRHPEIQSKLMGYVKRRRFELENQSGEVAS